MYYIRYNKCNRCASGITPFPPSTDESSPLITSYPPCKPLRPPPTKVPPSLPLPTNRRLPATLSPIPVPAPARTACRQLPRRLRILLKPRDRNRVPAFAKRRLGGQVPHAHPSRTLPPPRCFPQRKGRRSLAVGGRPGNDCTPYSFARSPVLPHAGRRKHPVSGFPGLRYNCLVLPQWRRITTRFSGKCSRTSSRP